MLHWEQAISFVCNIDVECSTQCMDSSDDSTGKVTTDSYVKPQHRTARLRCAWAEPCVIWCQEIWSSCFAHHKIAAALCQMIVCRCHDVMIAVATCCCILAPVVPYDLILFTSLLNCCMLSSKYCNAQQHFEIVTIINGLWWCRSFHIYPNYLPSAADRTMQRCWCNNGSFANDHQCLQACRNVWHANNVVLAESLRNSCIAAAGMQDMTQTCSAELRGDGKLMAYHRPWQTCMQ